MKIHNYSAGPCILPKSVFKKAAESLVNYNESGLSIAEISHRSKEFMAVMENSVKLVKDLMKVPEGYEILFLQGGASMQFYMSGLNLLPEQGTAAYINTGTWSSKAIKEAKLLGNIHEVASSKNENFSYIPKKFDVPHNASFLHYTSNNTIFGTQFKEAPNTDLRLVCDMSSDIMTKEVDIKKYDLIYAGAQKNLGPAGVTLVIVKKDALGKTGRTIPSMLDYQVHIDKESMFNTPPCFSIYTTMLTMEWLKEIGGVEEIQKRNLAKSSLLYDEIDRNSLFEGTAKTEDRSVMNPTFILRDKLLNDEFLQRSIDAGISGIKGHRSVGGFRASMYNALDIKSVEALVNLMRDFEKSKG
ncbi:MAG: 3-phosphoserine/phosphohydroxythreonine aminotransferase [Flavobacteriales bacterium]|nr:3-phosphoserine/phosphohydroxythreonine aminotransferase [Flavobacteriales bacterium]|tara:strand:+ start:30996 stop:32066 length:1071 start_codon:yes stop_codon:yes gene_type:complete